MKVLIYGATTGQGDGIGRSVTLRLAQKGHEVQGLCRSEAKVLKEKEFPLEAIDIMKEKGSTRLKELIRTIDPDVIWSACGTGYAAPLWAMPNGEIEDMISANVRNNIYFSKICAPSCLDGGPHLILTGSVAGVLDGMGASVYAGAKGFLVPFVRAQCEEYRRQSHNPKISLLMLNSVRLTGIDVIANTIEFMGQQSRAMEVMIR